jgi:hypothetical protein
LGICLADNPNVLTDLERCREANRDDARCSKSPKPISSSLCPCEGAQASRKSLAELVDANDRAFRASRRQRAAWVASHAPECTELPVEGDRGFESISLQQRVQCEPDFLAFDRRLPVEEKLREGFAGRIAGVASRLPLCFHGGFPRGSLSEFRIARLLLGLPKLAVRGIRGDVRFS